MKRIFWTDVAVADLQNIRSYISRDSETYAQGLMLEIFNSIEQAKSFPKMGRVVPEFKKEDTREIIVGNYRIIYEITASSLRILTVLHGAQLLR